MGQAEASILNSALLIVARRMSDKKIVRKKALMMLEDLC